MKKFLVDYSISYTEKETGRKFDFLNPHTKIIDAEIGDELESFKQSMLDASREGFVMEVQIHHILELKQ